MNADLIASIITFVGAVVPLVIVIVQLIRKWSERKIETSDPLLIARLIKRHPIDQKLWKKIRLRRRINAIIPLLLYFIYFIIIFVLIASFLNGYIFESIYSLFYVINILLYILVLCLIFYNVIRNSFIFYVANAIDARYFFFTNIDIVIEADYLYLFNKCQEVLKKLKFYLIEVNGKEGKIEAYHMYWSFWFTVPARMSVEIKLVEAVNVYAVNLQYDILYNNWFNNQILRLLQSTIMLHKCIFFNHFTKLLLSKFKNSADSDKGYAKILEDVGD